ncbi:MAG TPA: hypothetical protein VF812_14315 [Ktedonobacterales bacterium]
MRRFHTSPAPFAPRRGYLIPALAFALSLPSLMATLSLSALAALHALSGRAFTLSAPPLRSPVGFAALVCYLVFGPALGFILCVSQRARAEQTYGSVLLLGYRMRRLNTLALWCAALALGVLMFILLVAMVARAGS